MDIKELEIQRAEEIIIDQFPPLVKTFILNSQKINKEVEKWENLLMLFMKDNGQIDGKALSAVFVEKYPKLAEWVTIPPYDFYLKDEISQIIKILFNRS